MLQTLKTDVRWVLIIALAIVAAFVIWKVVTFVTAAIAAIVTIAVVAALLYLVFLLARSALRGKRQSSPQ